MILESQSTLRFPSKVATSSAEMVKETASVLPYLALRFAVFGFGVSDGVWGLRLRLLGLGFGVWGLRFGAWD